jgi:RNA polymerase sigma-70 factor (ECF subfamily)
MNKTLSEATAFDRLMVAMRPRLHRYCARMIGSAIDAEDVVQDALAKATEALADAGTIDRPEAWLFRIAHNAALDHLRRRKRQAARRTDADLADVADTHAESDVRVAATASLATFLLLPATPRASVVLMDVLGHSLAETSDILGVSVATVKAALHRARLRLRDFAKANEAPRSLGTAERERLRAYADRFNAHDFDALRDLLAEDVRLDLVSRTRLAGRKDVSVYFTRYAEHTGWYISPGVAEGRVALFVSELADPSHRANYIILLEWANERITSIRDFRFAPYIMDSLSLGATGASEGLVS